MAYLFLRQPAGRSGKGHRSKYAALRPAFVDPRRLLCEPLEDRRMLSIADLSLVEDGLKAGFFDALQDEINAGAFAAPAPLMGGELGDPSTPLGQFAKTIGDRLNSFAIEDTGQPVKVAEVTRELKETLGELVVAPNGATRITVTGNDGDEKIVFQLILMQTHEVWVDLDLALPHADGEDAIVAPLIGLEDAVSVQATWTFDLTFGVDASGFFIATLPQDELSLDVLAILPGDFVGYGPLGLFSARYQPAPGKLSSFDATYAFDVLDTAADVDTHLRLTESGSPGVLELEPLRLSTSLTGSAAVSLHADAAFIPDFWEDGGLSDYAKQRLFNLAIRSDVDITYNLQERTGTGLPASVLSFSNVQMNLGEFCDGFVEPTSIIVAETVRPINGPLGVLTERIPVVSDTFEAFGMKPVTWIETATPLASRSLWATLKALGSPIGMTLGARGFAEAALVIDVLDRLVEDGQGVITNITQGNPAVVTSSQHGLSTGDGVRITGAWMTQLNDREFRVEVLDANRFVLVGEDSRTYPAYPPPAGYSTGKWEQIQGYYWHTPDNSLRHQIWEDLGSFETGFKNGQPWYTETTFDVLEKLGVARPGEPSHVSQARRSVQARLKEFGEAFRFPMLEDPGMIFTLMQGETEGVEMFRFGTEMDMALDVNFSWPVPLPPPFTPLTGLVCIDGLISLGAQVDLDFRQDGIGLESFSQSLDYSSLPNLRSNMMDNLELLREGFIFDDHNDSGRFRDGETAMPMEILGFSKPVGEKPEMAIVVKVGIGASLNIPKALQLGPLYSIKAGCLGYLEIVVGRDLNDLPNDPYPANPDDYEYDGLVRLSEQDRIRMVDPGAIYNPTFNADLGLECFFKVSIWHNTVFKLGPYTILSFPLNWGSWNLANKTDDQEILTGEPLEPAVLGAVDDQGVLALFLGPDADRRNVAVDSIDEHVIIESLGPTDPSAPEQGETLRVTLQDWYRQEFPNVKSITADGGIGKDYFLVRDGVVAAATLKGGPQNDELVYLGSGQATMKGDAGDDLLQGGKGNDRLEGGDGNDELSGGDGDDELLGGSGNDRLGGGSGNDILQGENGDDQLRGGEGNDQLYGGEGNDLLEGHAGDDLLHGDGGDDYLDGGAGSDALDGGEGSDEYDQQISADTDLFSESDNPADFDTFNLAGGIDDLNDMITLVAEGNQLRIATNQSSIAVPGIERLAISAGKGSDTVVVGDLGGTSLREVLINLAVGESADATVDTVQFLGTSGPDTILVEGVIQSIDQTTSGPDGEQSIQFDVPAVRITQQADPAVPREVLIWNSSTADRLEVFGLGDDDVLEVRAGQGGLPGRDLIAVALEGGPGSDTFKTPYNNVTVWGGTIDPSGAATDDPADTDTLHVADDRLEPGKPEVYVSDTEVVAIRGGQPVASVAYGGIENLQLSLGSDGNGNSVRVQSTIPGSVTINGGSDNDEITVVDAQGSLTLDLGGIGDHDTLTIDRRLAATGLEGALWADEMTWTGWASPIHYSNVEQLDLLLGKWADRLTIENTSADTAIQAGGGADEIVLRGIGSRTTVNGDDGDDTLTVEIDPAGPASFDELAMSVETLRVRHIGDPQPAAWRVEDGRIWLDNAIPSVAIAEVLGSGRVFLDGMGADTLSVADSVPTSQTVLLEGNRVRIQHGVEILSYAGQDFLEDSDGMRSPVITADGTFVYASSPDTGVNTFERNGEDGDLTRLSHWREQQSVSYGDQANDRCGFAVAISSDMAIIGIPGRQLAQIFRWESAWGSGWWQMEATLTGGAGFGNSVAISGGKAIVGAPYENGFGGAAYVFERDEGWTKTKLGEGAPNALFGWSVAISGDIAIVGAPWGNSATLFEKGGLGWEATELDGGLHFGYSVAISGDTAIVGAPSEDSDAGAAYLLQKDGASWVQTRLTDGEDTPEARFGSSVAISDGVALVGAPQLGEGPGAAFVFGEDGFGEWQRLQKLATAGSVHFGQSVAIDGDVAIVGDPDHDGGRGAASIFERDLTGMWNEAKSTAPDLAEEDHFGQAIAISGDMALIGAPDVDGLGPPDRTDAGQVFLFQDKTASGMTSIAVGPDDHHVYGAHHFNNEAFVFERDLNDGSLTLRQQTFVQSSYWMGDGAAVAISPDGEYVYYTSEFEYIVKFPRDPDTGLFTDWFADVAFSDGDPGPKAIALDHSAEHAYVAFADTDKLAVLARNTTTGELTSIPDQVFQDGIGGVEGMDRPAAVALSPDQAFLYVAGHDANAIAVFSRDPVTGELAFLESARNGSRGVRGLGGVSSLVTTDQYVFAVGTQDDSLVVFHRGVDGRLTFAQRLGNLFGDVEGLENPNAVAISADGNWLYVASSGEGAGRPGGLAWFRIAQDVPAARPLVVDYSGIQELTVQSGDGDDRVRTNDVPETVTVSVLLGEGFDELDLVGTREGATTKIYGEAGNDTVRIWATGAGSTTEVHAGGGNDTIRVAGDRLGAAVSVWGDDPAEAPGDLLVFAGDADPGPTAPDGTIAAGGTTVVAYWGIERLDFPDELPDANAGGTGGVYSLNEGGSLALDASASVLPGGAGIFEWDINGDGEFGDWVGPQPFLSWQELCQWGLDDNGTYQVSVQVTTSGGSDLATATVEIANVAPSLAVSSDSDSIDQFTLYVLRLTATDIENDAIEEWVIDWGDGSEGRVPGSAAVATHQYPPGTWDVVVVRAADEDGVYPVDWRTTVEVQAVEPLAGLSATDEGEAYSLALSGSPAFAGSTWIIDWGDGSPLESGVPGAALTHTYLVDGDLLIKGTAIRADDTYRATKPITVNRLEPELRIAGVPAADEGDYYTLFLAARYPGREEQLTWTIDWGDGASETFEGNTGTVRHLYADDSGAGVFQILVTAYDGDTTPEAPYQVSRVAVLDRPLFAFDDGPHASRHLYMLTSGQTSWDAAQGEAALLGGHLVEIADYAEQDFLDRSFFDTADAPERAWIGLTDLDGDGVLDWATGADMNYTRWAGGGSGGQAHAALVRQVDAGAATMGFEELVDGSAAYVESGLRLAAVSTNGQARLVRRDDLTGAAAAANAETEWFSLTDVDGHPFALKYLDIGSDAAATIAFTGTLLGGGTVTQTFDVADTGGGLQRLTFGGDFVDLVSVEWAPGASWADNVTVMRPLSLWAGASGLELLAGIVEMESILGLAFAEADGLEVSVSNVAPTVDLSGSDRVDEGSVYRLTIGSPIDSGSDTVARYIVYWGDDTPAETVEVSPDTLLSHAAAESIGHVYADAGVYEIRVEIEDEDGIHVLDPATHLTVVVDNVLPTIGMPADARVEQGNPLEVAGWFTDPGSDAWWATVDYGDGAGVQDLWLGPDKVFYLDHAYATTGEYVVEVRVYDGYDDAESPTYATAEMEVSVVVTAPEIVDYWSSGLVATDAGNLAYSFHPIRDGFVTAEVRQGSSAATEIALYAVGPMGAPILPALASGQGRIDFTQALAGNRYVLSLTGLDATAEVCLANLVQRAGSAVDVYGTKDNDPFVFDASAGCSFTIKEVSYQFAPGEVGTFSFDGLAGCELVQFVGGPGPDTATLRPTSGTFAGEDYTLNVSNVEVFDYDGGAGDVVTIWGSKQTETYTAEAGWGWMTGDDVSIHVTAENIYARGNGGGDTVYFKDGDGDDVLEYFSWWARMRGDGYFHHVRGFKTMQADAEAVQGDADRVVVRGSQLNDYLRVNPYNETRETSVVRFLSGSGSVWHYAYGYETIAGYGLGGALADQLFLNDTPGTDTFDVRRLQASLEAPDYAVSVATHGFGTVEVRRAYANEAADEISLGDSVYAADDDTVVGDPTQVTMSGPGYINKALNFPSVNVHSSGRGNDTAHLSDLADPADSRTGVDTFTGRPIFSTLVGPGYRLYARLFDEVHVESKYGLDIANLYGNVNGAELTGTAAEVRLSGTHSSGSYANHARSFHEVNAFGASDVDHAALTDAAVDLDSYGPPAGVPLDELAQILWLDSFEKIERWNSGTGSKVDDIDDVDRVFAWWDG